METPSRVATSSLLVAALGALLFVAGPALIQAGILGPEPGFRMFGLGFLCGIVATILGVIGLLRTRASAGRVGRPRALAGTFLGLTMVVTTLSAASSGRGVPTINDITTNPDDPPIFQNAKTLEGNAGNDLDYPGAEFAEKQRAGYPDLAPIEVSTSPGETFARAKKAARELGWEIVYENEGEGVIEATQTSGIFLFVDDIAVRIRTADGGSVVDVRSKSRVGRGDLGANAARIRALRDTLQ